MFADREICKEVTTEPSMVLPCHNLTVAEIFRDYCRGIVHTSGATGMYDTDDPNAEPQYTDEYDSQDIMNHSFSTPPMFGDTNAESPDASQEVGAKHPSSAESLAEEGKQSDEQ